MDMSKWPVPVDGLHCVANYTTLGATEAGTAGAYSMTSLAGWVTPRLGFPVTLGENPAGIEKPDWAGVLYGVRRDG